MAIYRIPIEIGYTPGGPGVNVWHCRADNSGDVDQLVAALHDFYTGAASLLQSDMLISLGQVLNVATREPWAGNQGPWATPIDTTGTLDKAPQGLAVTISWKTSQATRRGSGRTFLGPLSKVIINTDGILEPTYKATLNTAVSGLLADSDAVLGGSLGVYGYESAKLPGVARDPNSPRVLRDFVGYTISDEFAMLRRRRD